MMMMHFVFLLLFTSQAFAEINLDSQQLSIEYGTSFHTVNGKQKENSSSGRLTSNKMPFLNGAWTIALGNTWALQLFGGAQFIRFNDPPGTFTLKKEDVVLAHYGLELKKKISAIAKFGVFSRFQDHPLYFAKTPTEVEIFNNRFLESGIHYELSQRRRIGLLWGIGAKGFVIFPSKGGNVTTESGAGGEAYGRLGWVGPFGTQYQIKGFYQYTTAPNAEITFEHENLGYSLIVSYSY